MSESLTNKLPELVYKLVLSIPVRYIVEITQFTCFGGIRMGNTDCLCEDKLEVETILEGYARSGLRRAIPPI